MKNSLALYLPLCVCVCVVCVCVCVCVCETKAYGRSRALQLEVYVRQITAYTAIHSDSGVQGLRRGRGEMALEGTTADPGGGES